MDRRKFLQSLFVLGIATAIDVEKAIEQTLIDTAKMNDEEFIAYVKFTVNTYIVNPAQCMFIDGIEELEEFKEGENK